MADYGNNRIARYDAGGNYVSSFGSYGTSDGQLSGPSGITVDISGEVYVSEYSNSRIQKFHVNQDGSVSSVGWFGKGQNGTGWHPYGSGETGMTGTGDGQFRLPTDVVYSNGYLYVTDLMNHRVQKLSVNQDGSLSFAGWFGRGQVTTGWHAPGSGETGVAGGGDGEFRFPQGLGADASGKVYVADTSNHRIQKLDSGGFLGWIGKDGNGDTGWHDPLSLQTGVGGSGDGQFLQPFDVEVDALGRMVVAEMGNNRIQKLGPNGAFSILWDGTTSGQAFNGPRGVALSSRVYVVDTANNRLQSYDLATTAAWIYDEIGNMMRNDGADYSYGSKPHAVTGVETGPGTTNSYIYDLNGNMTSRAGQTLTWDVENRMTGAGSTSFIYDPDGFRVMRDMPTTFYINKYYEKTGSVATLYYYLGNKLVAFKKGSDLRYVSQDHLTGTALTTDVSGEVVGTVLYAAYGQTRASTGSLETDRKYTGQRLDGTGLYYYGARYYDPSLGRFVSADTIVPSYSNPQALNRYSYAYNNPLKYIDQDGHFPWLIPVVGAIVGAGVNTGIYVWRHRDSGLTAGGIAEAAVSGAVAGAMSVVPIPGVTAVIGGFAASVVSGAVGSSVGYLAGEGAETIVSNIAGNPDESSPSLLEAGVSLAGGAVGAVTGQAISAGLHGLSAGLDDFSTVFRSSINTFETDSIEAASISTSVSTLTSVLTTSAATGTFSSSSSYEAYYSYDYGDYGYAYNDYWDYGYASYGYGPM